MDAESINPLELPATPHKLRQLAKQRVLKPSALEQALRLIEYLPGRSRWAWFLDGLLLVLGVGFVVCGVFFFFAFNWAAMHRFAKLGILEAVVLLTVSVTAWQKLDRLPGKIALSAAGLLLGALLAVYGQIYHTGADGYQLFLTWAVLMSGWVFIGQFAPLWFIWVLILNLSLWFYGQQVIGFNGPVYLGLFLLNGGAILSWEIAHGRGVTWLASRWMPRLLALLTFAALVAPTLTLIFAASALLSATPWLILMAVLFVLVSALVLYLYSQRLLDLFMLMVAAFSLMITLNAWLFRILTFQTATLCFMALIFIGQAALMVTWVRHLARN